MPLEHPNFCETCAALIREIRDKAEYEEKIAIMREGGALHCSRSIEAPI